VGLYGFPIIHLNSELQTIHETLFISIVLIKKLFVFVHFCFFGAHCRGAGPVSAYFSLPAKKVSKKAFSDF
jgi:hypothetical protein